MGQYATSVASFATSINSIDVPVSTNVVASLCYQHEEYKNKKLLSTAYNGLASKAHRIMSYGASTYTYGLPDGYEVYYNYDILDVKEVLETELGYEVDILSASIAAPEATFFGYMYAYLHWGLDQATGLLSVPPLTVSSNTLYLINVEMESSGDLKYTLASSANSSEEYYKYVYVSDEYNLTTSNLYYQVRYSITGSVNAREQFWFYKLGEGTYPSLDIEEEIEFGSPFLPIIPLRESNTNLGPEIEDGEYVRDEDGNKIVPDTELYVTSKKLCDLANADFDELCKEISDNPDIDDIDHAYLIFGIDIRSTSIAGKHYLFQFFEDLAFRTVGEGNIEIKDAKYRIKISFDSCTYEDIEGELTLKTEIEYNGNTMVLKRRTSDTTYRQVTVTKLLHTNYIYKDFGVETSLSDSEDEDDYNFIIPLNYELSRKDRGMFKREELYVESLKLVFNSYERKKLKWYQTSLFGFILMVAGIALTIFGGVGGAIVNAIQQGIRAVVILALKLVVASVAIKFAFQKLVEVLGVEFAAILAIVALVAAAYTGYTGYDSGGINAENLLSLSNGIMTGIQADMSASMEKLAKEIADFTSTASELEDELSELEDELNSTTWFDVYDFLTPGMLFIANETPDEYYTRTIHTGNIGVASLSTSSEYVKNMLLLPEFTEI